jgi:polyisoprenyl-teichoic acid--peptidoglycan teichoic acid transferase
MTALQERPPARERARRALRRHRLVVGCLIAVLCGAGIGAAFVLGQVLNLRDALSQNATLSTGGTLASAGYGDAETLLLVGDDQRSLTGAFKHYSRAVLPHSNEMLLVRIDPNQPYISMMSVPRELEATIRPPGKRPVTTRFNYAYTAGGIPLLVSTIHQVLGLSVNHVMVITFGRFRRAVDEMGCVFSTVDRRYFHLNVPGSEQYQEVNLQPGYQQLCGAAALEFVSYRHGDDSLVRDARDQSLLLDVKKQYGPTLAGNVGQFEHIFGKAVQTDPGLHSSNGILDLIGTLISSSARAVRQVHFQVNLSSPQGSFCACVTASPQQIHASVDSFLRGPPPATPHGRSAAATAHRVGSRGGLAHLPLVATSPLAVAAARTAASHLPLAYEFPQVQDRAGVTTPVYLHNYILRAPGHGPYPAYVAVFATGQLGQYYDVQGTGWAAPPLLAGPTQTVQAGGRALDLYYQSGQLEMVAWHEHGGAYWVRNSLTQALPPGEMLAIAEQTRVLPVVTDRSAHRAAVSLRAARVRFAPAHAAVDDLRQTLGGLAGLLSLVLLVALGVLALRRRRGVGALREELEAHLEREGRVRARLTRRRPGAPGRRQP